MAAWRHSHGIRVCAKIELPRRRGNYYICDNRVIPLSCKLFSRRHIIHELGDSCCWAGLLFECEARLEKFSAAAWKAHKKRGSRGQEETGSRWPEVDFPALLENANVFVSNLKQRISRPEVQLWVQEVSWLLALLLNSQLTLKSSSGSGLPVISIPWALVAISVEMIGWI